VWAWTSLSSWTGERLFRWKKAVPFCLNVIILMYRQDLMIL
jgi:hypothetical protein